MYLSNTLQVTNNKLTTYFPIRTKDERRDFDWNSVLGMVIAGIYHKELKDKDLTNFALLCHEEFKERLDDPSFWEVIKKIYFDNEAILDISPEFLLFKSQLVEQNKHNQRIGLMFINLFENTLQETINPIRLNFLEKIIYEVLIEKVLKSTEVKLHEIKEEIFLPFLSVCFQKDFEFLASKPRYLLESFDAFLRLYGFLYTSQLAHNLSKWDMGEPEPVPSYLILDTEKASTERLEIYDFGYKFLSKNLTYIFPYLTMSEMLQKKKQVVAPLWKLADSIREQQEVTEILNDFAYIFCQDRKLDEGEISRQATPELALKQVLNLSLKQFKTGNKDKDDININFAKAASTAFCADFIQQRGAAGTTLVINQDYLLLLTNLSIGKQEKLRFNELLKAFEQRGIFFDKQSQAEIVQFYERIGNVERMSDSGDAVYVKKTV